LERDETFMVTLNVVPELPGVDIGPLDVLEVIITDNEGVLNGDCFCLVILTLIEHLVMVNFKRLLG